MKKLRNMKIGSKIGGGFFLVLILTVLVAFIGWNGLRNVESRSQNLEEMKKLQKYAADTKGYRLQYMLTEQQKDLDALHDTVKKMNKIAVNARDNLFNDKLNKDQMNDVLHSLKDYTTNLIDFEKLFKAEKQEDLGMVKVAVEFGQTAAQNNLDNLEKLALNVRIQQKNYIVYREEKYADNLRALMKKIIAGVNKSGKSELIKMAKKYNEDFENFLGIIQKQMQARKKLTTSAASIIKVCDVAVADQEKKMKSEMQAATLIGIIFSVIAVILGIIITLVITRNITHPIGNFMEKFRKGTEGYLDIEVNIQSQDEIGQLANFFNVFMNKLREIVSSIVDSSHQVLQATSEVSQGNQDLSNRVSAQSASLEETASSIEEMTANLKNMAENAVSTQEVVGRTRQGAQEGRTVIGKAVEAIQSVNEQAAKISEIVKIIDGIAFQTNILALNAAVEAARAKEHGKGFAVVANEVRNLAQKSAENAKQIEGMIGSIVKGIEEGNRQVEVSQKKFLEIQGDIEESGSLINEVSASAEEQSNGVDQINQAISHLDEITQNNASLVEELSASTEELESQTREVIDMMSFFKLNESGSNSIGNNQTKQKKKLSSYNGEKKSMNHNNKSTSSSKTKSNTEEKKNTNKETKHLKDDGFVEF